MKRAKRDAGNWVWAAALLLLFLGAAGAAWRLSQGEAGGRLARVYQDGRLIEEIDLAQVEAPYELRVETEAGSNTLCVSREGICVQAADCADQTCVRQGWLRGGLTPIVCLPHRLVICLEEAETTGALDGVAG